MNNKTKIISLIMVSVVMLSLCSCGSIMKLPVDTPTKVEKNIPSDPVSTEDDGFADKEQENQQEEIPSTSEDVVETPGPDVVCLVNLRGDETTAYKLIDGTYMDRIDRIFTYNGTDTWTDENGVEWNETVE